jgi:hypothetical protein
MKLKERYPFLPFTHAFETMINRLMVCTVLAGVSCALLSAQNVVLTGSLGGRVTDPSGSVVRGASVVVQSLARTCASSSRGNLDTGSAGLEPRQHTNFPSSPPPVPEPARA